MQQWWFDNGLRLKSVYDVFFYDFSLIFKVFINIQEYASKIICIFDQGMKGLCLSFKLSSS